MVHYGVLYVVLKRQLRMLSSGSISPARSASKALVGEYDPEGGGARGRRDPGKQEKGQQDVWNM